MRVVSNYQVCSPVNDAVCCCPLIIIRVMVTLYAPVTAGYDDCRALLTKLSYTVLDICLAITVCDKRLADTIPILVPSAVS